MEGRAWDYVRQESKDWGSCWVNMLMQLTINVSKLRFTCLCSWPWMFQSSDSHADAADHEYFKVEIHMPVQLTMNISKLRFTCLCSWPWIFQSSDSHACAVDHEYFKAQIHMPMQLTMNISKLRFTCLCSWPWIFQSWDSKIFSGELVASFDWSDRWVEANM